MRIHAGTLGTLLREVGRSLSGRDLVFCPGKKNKKSTACECTCVRGAHFPVKYLSGIKCPLAIQSIYG